MSFMDPKPLTPGALDAAAAALAGNPASALAGELSATILDNVEDVAADPVGVLQTTYVTFRDSGTGLPITGKHVTMTIDQTANEIVDIVVEDI